MPMAGRSGILLERCWLHFGHRIVARRCARAWNVSSGGLATGQLVSVSKDRVQPVTLSVPLCISGRRISIVEHRVRHEIRLAH